jgi:hypothetical protein
VTRTNVSLLLTLCGSVTAAVIGAACSTGAPASPSMAMMTPDGGGTNTNPDGGVSGDAAMAPFVADPPSVYVAKVKNILVGLPPTDAEVQTVTTDPTQLKTLVETWMQLPQYQEKMERFFELAFEQTQVQITDYADQVFPVVADRNGFTSPPLVQNLSQSFARTALAMACPAGSCSGKGQPFTNAITTDSLMMTTAVMEFYAFLDVYEVDSDDKVTDRFAQTNPQIPNITVEYAQGPIAIADTLNPANPATYMHWYDPDLPNIGKNVAGCTIDPVVYPTRAESLHSIILGGLSGYKAPGVAMNCPPSGGSATSSQLLPTDFTDWRLVTITPSSSPSQTTPFYNLPALRGSSTLSLQIPRVGFFSTPAFAANWQTNQSNTMRVTTNQALIVALGQAIDGTDHTTPTTTPGIDEAHMSDPSCVTCHQLLDPTRSILAKNWSWSYHDQTVNDSADGGFFDQPGQFAFEGVVKPVANITEFAATLAGHPLFAQAWVEKLCFYVNSGACDNGGFTVPKNSGLYSNDDTEFDRIVGVFQTSGYDWNTLVKELVSSPITTHAANTQTTIDQGDIIAVERRDHICAAWNARFGFSDICGLDVTTRGGATGLIPEIVAGLPSDGYGRGSVKPVLPNNPTIFFRAGMENICETMAAELIDPKTPQAGVVTWSSAEATAAISDFVTIVAGLPASDPRNPQLITQLTQHNQTALQGGWIVNGMAQPAATPTNALRSTFVVACLSPSSVTVGL